MSNIKFEELNFEQLQDERKKIKLEMANLETQLDQLSDRYFNMIKLLQDVCNHKLVYEREEYFCKICMLTSRDKKTFETDDTQVIE
tara:strand:+ start:5335 stop:5592 length:258 start_codon:yes stop_codon:yes gene_type:complete